MTHPIRDAEIVTWRSADDDCPANYKWLARLTPFSVYPVTAHGQTREECVAKLEALRTEAIEKHEKEVIQRQMLAKAAKAAREKKAKV